MKRTRLRRGSDRGESLIELLVTIVIIGITVPAIMGAVLLSVSVSNQDRQQAQAQALVSDWAETIARESTDATYTSCPAPAFYETTPFAPADVPVGFTYSVVAISYWVKGVTGPGSFVSSCTPDSGVRRLTLKVAMPAGLYPSFEVVQSIVVRRPCISC